MFMKKAIFPLLFLSCLILNAQKDSTPHYFKITDNRYGLFHRTIKTQQQKRYQNLEIIFL